jgi:hypothetical protein
VFRDSANTRESEDTEKRNQRQPFQWARRIEPPLGVDRHQSNGGKEMPGVPPYCHSGIHEPAGERPDNNFFFADAAVLKPHRHQAQNNGDQEKWPGPDRVALEVRVGSVPGAFFVPPPGAKQQDNW